MLARCFSHPASLSVSGSLAQKIIAVIVDLKQYASRDADVLHQFVDALVGTIELDIDRVLVPRPLISSVPAVIVSPFVPTIANAPGT